MLSQNEMRVSLLLFVVGMSFVFIGVSAQSKIPQTQEEVLSQNISATPSPTPAINSKETVLISKVLDGDTVETSKGEKIRYLGINSPENGEPYSKEASEKNSQLVLGKNVQLEFDVQNKDRYGRTLAYVFIDKTLINVELVKLGLAVSETIQPNVKYQGKILASEKEARSSCLGIWSGLCSKTSGSSNSNCIKIVTINADAPGNDNNNKNGEWIKIGNSCTNSVQLEGWFIKDSSASNRYTFKNFLLDSSSQVIIHSGCGIDSQTELFWKCPEGKYAVWNNAGDHAFLYNNSGDLVSDYEY